MLHEKRKVFALHMDGRLFHLKGLIAETPVDGIESFTLCNAGGNLSLEEVHSSWPRKAIIADIPTYSCFREREMIAQKLHEVVWEADRSRFMLAVSEALPPQDMWSTLETITKIRDSWEGATER